MPQIHNKTQKPLTVPLPGGKKLRLGPLRSGTVTPKALEHPPLKRLVEADQIEITVEDDKRGSIRGGKGLGPGRQNTTGGIQHTGDR